MRLFGGLIALLAFLTAATSWAGEADIVDAQAHAGADGTWRFVATVEHDDEGWQHYADRWEVVGPDGEILGTRQLAHPHVDEQPFTRSLSGVSVPEGVTTVTIRAHDSVHGYGGATVMVELSGR
jgi:hypothetical protein